MLKPNDCIGCPLEKIGNSFSLPDGLGRNGVAIIGEGLGHSEAIDGKPFRPYAPSGSLLEKAFRLIGVSRSQFILDNIIKCNPPGDELVGKSYEKEAIKHCVATHFRRIFNVANVKCIVAVGGTALRTATGYAGKRQGLSDLRGFVLDGIGEFSGFPIIGTYHPSFIRQSGKLAYLDYLVHDLKKAMQIAKGFEIDKTITYCTHPSIEDAKRFLRTVLDNPNALVAYDIETEQSKELEEDEREGLRDRLVSIQFSLGEKTGICLDFNSTNADFFSRIAKAVLKTRNPKIGHNVWAFDNPILRANGYEINGRVDDTMWMFHHFKPDLEMGLQKVASMCAFPFPWKHKAGDDSKVYECADVDVLHRIFNRLRPAMETIDVWRGYDAHVAGLHPILQAVSDRGMGIDQAEQTDLISYLEANKKISYKKIQSEIPDSLKGFHPKDGYKKTPPIVSGYSAAYVMAKEKASPGAKVISFEELIRKKTFRENKNGVGEYLAPRDLVVADKDGLIQEVQRWAWTKDFNPTSSKQLMAYIRSKGHPVPRKSDGKETTEARELERLARSTKDKFYDEVISYRQYDKMLNNDMPNWSPREDGAVHTTFTFAPATPQLSSRNPNIQNANKHKPLGKRFRRIIYARTGEPRLGRTGRRRLIELDYRAFHAVMLGREANYDKYIKLAGCDPHSWFTGYIVGHPIECRDYTSPQALKEFANDLKEIKREFKLIRDTQAKPALLGIGLGLQARKLYWYNREQYQDIGGKQVLVGIKDEAQAKRLLGMLKELLPPLFKYQEEIKEKAASQHYLKTVWGAIRWFYDVNGEDGERAIALPVQGNAHGMIKDKILKLSRIYRSYGVVPKFHIINPGGEEYAIKNDLTCVLDWYRFINIIHDSLVFEPDEEDEDECIRIVSKVMESPCKELALPDICPNGLVVGVDAMVGENWGPWDRDENIKGMREYKIGG